MNMRSFLLLPAIFAIVVLFLYGCDKERIVESTEIVRDVEYIEVTDTVYQVDTVFSSDSVSIVDSVIVYDTVVQTNTVYDTTETIVYQYDTTIITDTVSTPVYDPSASLAFSALQYHTDPMVMDLVYADLGISQGYIFYQTSSQLDLTQVSTGVYDIYGLIDFWTTDWSSFYPIEYFWRMTYLGGDPDNPSNWQISDPPTASISNPPGLFLKNASIQKEPAR